jgi:hypothetical protein
VRILALLLLALLSAPALAEGSITIGFIGQDRPPVRPVWPLNRELRDVGLMGAPRACRYRHDRAFHGAAFTLAEQTLWVGDNAAQAARLFRDRGTRLVVADFDAPSETHHLDLPFWKLREAGVTSPVHRLGSTPFLSRSNYSRVCLD